MNGIQQSRKQGVTQKAFVESIGMSSQKLSAIKSNERRNRDFYELGATKLACLWVLERFGLSKSIEITTSHNEQVEGG